MAGDGVCGGAAVQDLPAQDAVANCAARGGAGDRGHEAQPRRQCGRHDCPGA